MMHCSRRLLLTVAAGLLLATPACGSEDNGGQPPPATIPRDNTPAPVVRAIEVAATDAGVDSSEVGLIAYEEVEWNDTALGCSKPGSVYAQVITPGYDVRLLVNGNQREYHTDMATAVVRCDG